MWIDCEMTGLDLGADALVEVAALVTDFDLNVLGEGVDVVIKPPQEALDQMVEFVRDMHVSSGLLEELDAGTTLAARATTSTAPTATNAMPRVPRCVPGVPVIGRPAGPSSCRRCRQHRARASAVPGDTPG